MQKLTFYTAKENVKESFSTNVKRSETPQAITLDEQNYTEPKPRAHRGQGCSFRQHVEDPVFNLQQHTQLRMHTQTDTGRTEGKEQES